MPVPQNPNVFFDLSNIYPSPLNISNHTNSTTLRQRIPEIPHLVGAELSTYFSFKTIGPLSGIYFPLLKTLSPMKKNLTYTQSSLLRIL